MTLVIRSNVNPMAAAHRQPRATLKSSHARAETEEAAEAGGTTAVVIRHPIHRNPARKLGRMIQTRLIVLNLTQLKCRRLIVD
jgi:hypothetical protein